MGDGHTGIYLPENIFNELNPFYPYGATEENRHPVIPDILVPAEEALNTALKIISGK